MAKEAILLGFQNDSLAKWGVFLNYIYFFYGLVVTRGVCGHWLYLQSENNVA